MNVISVLLSAALVTQPQGSPRISLAPADEAGELLIVSGRVVGPDGKTPVANASLYVYQTDKDGSYPDTQNPRAHSLRREGDRLPGEDLRDRLRERPAGE